LYDFEGKVAIITGAARGIGKATAWAFARRGAAVAIVDINGEGAEKVASNIRSQGLKALAVTTDISESNTVDNMTNQVLQEFGRIDILVNNAYISGGPALITETSEETWDRVIAVNLKGYFNCAKAAARTMIAQRSGKIVNISSGAGVSGSLSSGVQYPASKAGIIGLTKGLAGELAPFGINVNCICPGLIKTRADEEMTDPGGWTPEKVESYIRVEVPLGRQGRPEDIAETVVFLSSEGASYIVGEVINVNGGDTLDSVAKRESLLGF